MQAQPEKPKCPCGLSTGYYRARTKDWHCTRCGRNTPMKAGDEDAAGPQE